MANTQEKTEQERLLQKASENGDVAAVRALLETGTVDVDAVDKFGATSLHIASFYGHSQIIELLLSAGASANAATEDEYIPLHQASLRGHSEAVRLLLAAGANPNATGKNGSTPLHLTSSKGHFQVAELLVTAGADINAPNKIGWTPLHIATSYGHLSIVELFVKAGQDLNPASENGWAPLHFASSIGHLAIAELLVKAGQDPNAASKDKGETPLHLACKYTNSDVVRALLTVGADLHTEDYEGHEPLQLNLLSLDLDISESTMETMQVLVSFGATWNTKCDELVSSGKARVEAPALHLCMNLWCQELANGLPFTNIPLEIIKRGADNTQTYIDDLKKSAEVVLRRKVCLVGCGCAGKTSLIKSITSEKPQLAHVDDRTIGIDHFPFRFSESDDDGKRKIHEVTFWDFAGQDAYQVAHSLFFSPRTLYLVCVDLEAFTTAFLQASIMSFAKKQETQLMNEFIDRTVMRWIRMIVARQPDAEFVFIATKEDLLAENQVTGKLLKDHLKTKLAEVQANMHEMRSKRVEGAARSTQSDPKAANAATSNQPSILFVSCASFKSAQDARAEVEDSIVRSGNSFQMPDTYSRALEEIMRIREAAKHQDIAKRISQVFAPVDSLPEKLNIEPELCRSILQTLHDLGDVLWYEDLGVELFENTLILDPLLLIDFIRQVVNHKNTGQILPHADLKGMPYWLALDDDKQMEAMKTVLQKFHLVYSAREGRVMEWDSDLIVPAYWQTKTPAAWLFLGDILRINATQSCEGEAVRVHWEYHFEFGLPPSLFDHVVVASVSTYVEFDAGPDWIVYKEEDIAACRIMVGRDPKSLHRTIHVEAVVSETATEDQAELLWEAFEQLCESFVDVLRENRGLRVSSFAWTDKKSKIDMKRLLETRSRPSSRKWMPPAEVWERLRPLMGKK